MIRSQRLNQFTLIVAALALTSVCNAQQVYSTAPLVNYSDSYYESFGTDWGFSHRSRNGYMFFNRGGANTAIPAFGGYDPNAVARFGVGSRGSNGSFYFNAWAGQGSNRSVTSTAPGLMLQNGGQGFVQDISVRPFVTGLIPVVGNRSVSPVEERLERLRQEAALANPNSQPSDAELLLANPEEQSLSINQSATSTPGRSSAERGDISLAEIRRLQAARPTSDPAEELNQLIESAQFAEASGRSGAARIRYQQAAAKASGELKRALLAKYESLLD
ncbi:MAG: hypothetical protein H6821_12910 [Planctomycetaceae bacterium]|nr:hypothetical protein [Planctomycetales bacterium]MCB9875071.1 hypothetical protein [Planctomycetaceae bacterium]MCB9939905.1 hypothetical protein [Planctomycetaceae bacterium]HRX79173.1 hypothetical protein [Pirellulaceae bacterium]